MQNDVITSEPPAQTSKPTPRKAKKRKMSAAGRKALADAAKARWAAKKAASAPVVTSAPAPQLAPIAPAPPSPAVLKLQEQVIELVSQRHQARTMLNESHNAYLLAQSKFQAAENELKGIEAEVQYCISLIAQLENRPAQVNYSPAPFQLPPSSSMTGV
ncbi:MAG: hypothetical protein WCA31_10040, partial [Acidimicrobiales bacterium]